MFNVYDLCDIFYYFLLIGKCHQGLLIHKMPGLVTGSCKSLKDTFTIDTVQKRNSSIFVLSLQSNLSGFLPFLKDDIFKIILLGQTLFMFQESSTLSHLTPKTIL